MRPLIFVHRWLGVAFCLLFAMWFATGIVMHFVPFPALSEAERIAGLTPIAPATTRGPAAAVAASGIRDASRVHLLARPDALVYVVEGPSAVASVNAATLAAAGVSSESEALQIALGHARRRHIDAPDARTMALAAYDQWTIPNALDVHRPLYRVAVGDSAGTELYVSSRSGEVVRDTTRRERAWNYAGSVLHWIYPTVLRSNWRAWDLTVWTLSLVAAVGALAGALIGTLRVRVVRGHLASPYRGWQAWHHWLGLTCMLFVLTWIVSGWLSMDHGRLFSTGKLESDEVLALQGRPIWISASSGRIESASAAPVEIEWFFFGGRRYRRDIYAAGAQRVIADDASGEAAAFLPQAAITAAAERLSARCAPASIVEEGDGHRFTSMVAGAPVYRIVCGDVWYHVDAGNGAPLEKLDGSRRAYRWVYQALHTLDFPALTARPAVRTMLVVVLCAAGFAFSVTGVAIAWRRLRGTFSRRP